MVLWPAINEEVYRILGGAITNTGGKSLGRLWFSPRCASASMFHAPCRPRRTSMIIAPSAVLTAPGSGTA